MALLAGQTTLTEEARSQKRKMIVVLGDDDMGEQPGTGTASGARMVGRRRRNDGIAGAARQLLADVTDHLEPARHVIERLSDPREVAASRSAWSPSSVSIANSSWSASRSNFSDEWPNSAPPVTRQLEAQLGDLGLSVGGVLRHPSDCASAHRRRREADRVGSGPAH
jgi:hypothetical protein